MLTDQLAFVFVVHWGNIRRATYLCLDCTKSMHTNWIINVLLNFVVHVNFDNAWAENYPVALIEPSLVLLYPHSGTVVPMGSIQGGTCT